MTEDEFEKSFNQGKDPCYLIHGDEALLIDEATSYLYQRALNGGSEDFNVDRFSADDSQFSIDLLINSLQTMPMMSDKRVVYVKAAAALNQMPADKVSKLLKYLEKPSPEHCLILESKEKLDEKRSLYKNLSDKKLANIQCFEPFDEKKRPQLKKWLQGEAKKQKLKLNEGALELLVDCIGFDLNQLRAAFQKLSLFIHPRKDIEEKDIKELLPEGRIQADIFSFVDSLSFKHSSEALSKAHILMEDHGKSAIEILAMIYRRYKFFILYGVELKKGNSNPSDISKKIGSNYKENNVISQSIKLYSLEDLEVIFGLIVQADRMLKGSKIPPEVVLEKLVIDICQNANFLSSKNI